jgi:hypothetical protein
MCVFLYISAGYTIFFLFFAENAQLHDEFEALYTILFKRPENYLKVRLGCYLETRSAD